jgi:hypothetical protein
MVVSVESRYKFVVVVTSSFELSVARIDIDAGGMTREDPVNAAVPPGRDAYLVTKIELVVVCLEHVVVEEGLDAAVHHKMISESSARDTNFVFVAICQSLRGPSWLRKIFSKETD